MRSRRRTPLEGELLSVAKHLEEIARRGGALDPECDLCRVRIALERVAAPDLEVLDAG